MSHEFCCDEFAEQAGGFQSVGPSAIAYASAGLSGNAQFERDEDGVWNIAGCCGGACYVVTDMRYCPYCGTLIVQPPTA